MEAYVQRLCQSAGEMFGMSLRVQPPDQAEALYPDERELFTPEQFMNPGELSHLIRRSPAGTVFMVQDRASSRWFVAVLPEAVILGGPYLNDMITRIDAGQLYESLMGKPKGLAYFYEGENEDQRRFREYLMMIPFMHAEKAQRLVTFLFRSLGWEEPITVEEMCMLHTDYTAYRQTDFNKYLGYLEDCEAGLTASVAHGIDTEIPDIIRTLYDSQPVASPEAAREGELVRFVTVTQLIRNGARRAGVPATATVRTLQSFVSRLHQISERDDFRRLAEEFAMAVCHLVKTCSNRDYSPLVSSVMDRIRSSYTQRMSLRTIAADFGVNASYLASCFKRETGVTVGEYITRLRLEYARTLLTVSTQEIAEISQTVGIQDHSYFTRLFREHYGVSPSAYRQRLSTHSKPAGDS